MSSSISSRIQQALHKKDSIALLKYYRAKAIFLEWDGWERESISAYETALSLAISRRMNAEAGFFYLRLGKLYQRSARYDLAFDHYLKGLAIAESSADTLSMVGSYLGIAAIYEKLEDPEMTISLISRCEQLGYGISKNNSSENLLISFTLLQVDLGNTDQARDAITQLAERTRIRGGTISGWSNFVSGKLFLQLNDAISAEKEFTEAISVGGDYDAYLTAKSLFCLALIRFQQGLLSDAVAHLAKCTEIGKENSFNEVLLDSYDLYVQIYRKMDDLTSLARYQGLYINQMDLVFGEKILVRLSSLQAEFATRD